MTDDIPTPTCQSHGCTRSGYVRSEQYGLRLCPLHALNGPVQPPTED
jgi:hypothetical protein